MVKTINEIQDITIPRSFYRPASGKPVEQQLFVFADASDLAICYVIYLRTTIENGNINAAFVTGKSLVVTRGTASKSNCPFLGRNFVQP